MIDMGDLSIPLVVLSGSVADLHRQAQGRVADLGGDECVLR